MIRRILAPVLARLGSRTILTVGGTLFLLNMLIPDPLPLVDEFLILAGTMLLSRWARQVRRCVPMECGRDARCAEARRPEQHPAPLTRESQILGLLARRSRLRSLVSV